MDSIYPLVGLAVLLAVLFIAFKVFMKPIQLLWKLVFNSAIGLVLLIVVNYLGAYVAFSIPINIITVLIAGFLGVPGVVLLAAFQILLK